jgi:hypothetical protein
MKKNVIPCYFLVISILAFSCSIFKSTDNIKKRAINSYSFNYPQSRVWDALMKVMEDMKLRILSSDPLKGELKTEKITFNKDEIDNFQKLKEIGQVPKSPLSEYFEANYLINISMFEEKGKTEVDINLEIQALERGRFNKWIDIKSNGQKEKDILSLLLKKIKEY